MKRGRKETARSGGNQSRCICARAPQRRAGKQAGQNQRYRLCEHRARTELGVAAPQPRSRVHAVSLTHDACPLVPQDHCTVERRTDPLRRAAQAGHGGNKQSDNENNCLQPSHPSRCYHLMLRTARILLPRSHASRRFTKRLASNSGASTFSRLLSPARICCVAPPASVATGARRPAR